jgi:hypothetical protein
MRSSVHCPSTGTRALGRVKGEVDSMCVHHLPEIRFQKIRIYDEEINPA